MRKTFLTWRKRAQHAETDSKRNRQMHAIGESIVCLFQVIVIEASIHRYVFTVQVVGRQRNSTTVSLTIHTHRYPQNTNTQSTPKSIFAARNILYWMQLRLMIYEWTTVTLAASICHFENRNAFIMSFKWLDDSPHTNWNCSVSFRYWSLHSTRRYLAIIKNDFQATESIRVCGVCLCDGDGGHNQYSFVCVRRIQAPWVFSSFANGLSNTIYDRIVLNGDAVDVIWPFYFWPINTGECGGWPQFCLLFVLVATQCLCEWNTCGYRATNAPCNR